MTRTTISNAMPAAGKQFPTYHCSRILTREHSERRMLFCCILFFSHEKKSMGGRTFLSGVIRGAGMPRLPIKKGSAFFVKNAGPREYSPSIY